MAKNNGLSKKKQRLLILEIKKKIGQGLSDDEIMEALEIRPNAFAAYRRKMSQTDLAVYTNMDSVAVFSDYCLRMKDLVCELNTLKRRFKVNGQWTASALVSAVKQKKEIHDSVIKMGQELGFIERKAKELKFEGSMTFSTMTEKDVKKEIEIEVNKLQSLMTNPVDMRQELLDVTPDEVKKYMPKHVANIPIDNAGKRQTKTKIKLLLRKKY